MNFMIWSPQNLPAHVRPLHHQRLTVLLKVLEVQKLQKVDAYGSKRHAYFDKKLSPESCWELLETARNNYRRLIRQHHPDRGGSHDLAATLTAAWSRVKELFKRRGFELA